MERSVKDFDQFLWGRDFAKACFTGIEEAAVVVGAVAAVAGAGVSYMGAQAQGQAAANAATYNAEVNANNQQMADAAAVTALQQGAVAQQQKAYQEDVLIGQQKAGLAANGIDVGSGTAVDLLADTKAAGEFDQLTITNNAARTAQGFENQGINYQNQAVVNEQESAAALQGGELKADSALITGAGSVANSWYRYAAGSSSSGLSSPAFSSSPQAGAII